MSSSVCAASARIVAPRAAVHARASASEKRATTAPVMPNRRAMLASVPALLLATQASPASAKAPPEYYDDTMEIIALTKSIISGADLSEANIAAFQAKRDVNHPPRASSGKRNKFAGQSGNPTAAAGRRVGHDSPMRCQRRTTTSVVASSRPYTRDARGRRVCGTAADGVRCFIQNRVGALLLQLFHPCRVTFRTRRRVYKPKKYTPFGPTGGASPRLAN